MNSDLPQQMEEDLRLTETSADGTAEAWIWWSRVPSLPGERLGVIGHFSASSPSACGRILATAEAELGRRGCSLLVGPMDGNTWRSYRFVTDRGAEPPFFLEPMHPREWPAWWQAAGFAPLAEYYSSVTNDLEPHDDRLEGVAARMRSQDVMLRPIDCDQLEAELSRIHDLSLIAFRDNFLYTPLSKEAFVAQYLRIRERIHPALVLVAERGEQLVGYVFAIPDYAQALRQQPMTSVIVKTLAVLPERSLAGLGALLLAQVHEAARRAGFTRAIHALMHQSNKSLNLSARYGRVIRRYALFSKRVTR